LPNVHHRQPAGRLYTQAPADPTAALHEGALPMRRTMKMPALAAATLIALAGAGTAQAESSASSAVSNSLSTSVGSISTSFTASSDASSPGRQVKAGAYRVMEIAEAPGRAGYARLTLRAEAGAADASGESGAALDETAAQVQFLFLPQATVAGASLAVGQVIQARARPYGLELAKVAAAGEQAAEAFFLVVADDVYRGLQTRVVKL
jgi:hypothetical protein